MEVYVVDWHGLQFYLAYFKNKSREAVLIHSGGGVTGFFANFYIQSLSEIEFVEEYFFFGRAEVRDFQPWIVIGIPITPDELFKCVQEIKGANIHWQIDLPEY